MAGRLTAIVWMLAGAGLFTYITATITSAMTVETLNSDIQSVADLKTRKWPVGTVTGSTAATFLQRQGLTVQGFPDVDAACAALVEDKVKAVVYDAPMLLFYAKNHPEQQLGVVGELFENKATESGSRRAARIAKKITRAVLALREQGFFEELENKYFGTGTAASAPTTVAAR
ncbi:MAG: transporter substrate-binding domain-containing protein [Verrucomicrobiota bacterium]|nr:transporter substrate-binding domain-containing protein [Verrucomicrobiota bacterium]